MADLEKILAQIEADPTGFVAAMRDIADKVDDTTNKIAEKWKKVGDGMQKTGEKMSLYLTAPILLAGSLSVKAFAEAEESNVNLQAALANTGDATRDNMKAFEDYAKKIEKATTYDDDFILSQMALAKNMGFATQDLEKVTTAAIGLKAAYGIELPTGMKLLKLAQEGVTGAFTRYGIKIDDNLTKQQKFNKILELGTSKFNIAQAQALTTAGSYEQMKVAIGDLGEIIGKKLQPYILGITQFVKRMAIELQNASPHTLNMAIAIAAIVASIGPLLIVGGKMISVFADLQILLSTKLVQSILMMTRAAAPWLVIAVAIAAAAFLIYSNWDKVKLLFQSLMNGIGMALAYIMARIAQFLKVINIIPGIKKFFAQVESGFDNMADSAGTAFTKTAMDSERAGTWMGNAKKTFDDALDGIMGKFKGAASQAQQFIDTANAAGAAAAATALTIDQQFELLSDNTKQYAKSMENAFTDLTVTIVSSLAQGTFNATKVFLDFLTKMLEQTITWAITEMAVFQELSKAIAVALSNPIVAIFAIGGLIAAVAALSASYNKSQGMAQGGMVTSPTRALIGEGGRPEVVMPLVRASNGDMGVKMVGGGGGAAQGPGSTGADLEAIVSKVVKKMAPMSETPFELTVALDSGPIIKAVGTASRDGRLKIHPGAIRK